MANSRYGARQHCLSFLHLPPEERFEAAKAAMLGMGGTFHWPDSQLLHWCREGSHVVHEARQEALKEARAIARDRSAGR